jgi:tRNA A37 threonylcarbamoyladenosine dehydratase
MKTMKKIVLASLMGIALAASAAALKTDPAKSSVSAVFKQLNVPVESKFKKYTRNRLRRRQAGNAAKANVEVDVGQLGPSAIRITTRKCQERMVQLGAISESHLRLQQHQTGRQANSTSPAS